MKSTLGLILTRFLNLVVLFICSYSFRITVHKKTSRKTTIRDGEEVDVTEDVSTNVEEDGQEIESSELREDLQKMVDQFLTEGGGTTTVEVTEEAEESEI